MASRSIDLITKKTNCTCSALFFPNQQKKKKQICTCFTLFAFLCRCFAELQRCFVGLKRQTSQLHIIFMHRRTGNFRPGGGGKPFAQIFTKQSKRNESHTMQQHRPYGHMKVARYSFSGSIPAKLEHKLRCHKQTFGKIATTVVLEKDENWS